MQRNSYDNNPARRRERAPPEAIGSDQHCAQVGDEGGRGVPAVEEDLSVHVERLNTAVDLQALHRSIGRLVGRGGPTGSLDVDFTPSLAGGGRRYSPKWGAVLSNLLMGEYSGVSDLAVQLPESSSARLQLARAGLLFALAHHRGLSEARTDQTTLSSLDRWSRDWSPADFEEPLFRFAGEDLSVVPSDIESDLVAFLNPNYAPRDSEGVDMGAVTYPWLRSIFTKARIPNVERRKELMRDASFVVKELLNNVRDHSGMDQGGLSQISLFATGKGKSDTRVYLYVADNGIGMPSTLPGKSQNDEPAKQIEDAICGRLQRRERGRGDGLYAVRRLTEKYGGSLFLATGPAGNKECVVVEHDFQQKSRDVEARIHQLAVKGTIVIACLPVAKESTHPGVD